MLIDGRTNPGVGLIFVRDYNSDNGGIKLYAGTNLGQVVVDGLSTEGQKGEPAVWIAATGGSGDGNVTAEVRNVEVADATTTTPGFENDVSGGVVAFNIQGQTINVIGQVSVLSQYPNNFRNATEKPTAAGSNGILRKDSSRSER